MKRVVNEGPEVLRRRRLASESVSLTNDQKQGYSYTRQFMDKDLVMFPGRLAVVELSGVSIL